MPKHRYTEKEFNQLMSEHPKFIVEGAVIDSKFYRGTKEFEIITGIEHPDNKNKKTRTRLGEDDAK